MRLNEKQQKSVSKFLSLILRHRPEQIRITLDKNDWIDIDILLTQANHPKHNFTGVVLTYDTLMEIVENNDKKRFTISEDGIRDLTVTGVQTCSSDLFLIW